MADFRPLLCFLPRDIHLESASFSSGFQKVKLYTADAEKHCTLINSKATHLIIKVL